MLLSRSQRTVAGYLTEAYALKRYSGELERMRSAELGQRDLFSIGPLPNSKPPESVPESPMKSSRKMVFTGRAAHPISVSCARKSNAASTTFSRPSPC